MKIVNYLRVARKTCWPEWNYLNSTIIFNVHYFGFPTLLFPCAFLFRRQSYTTSKSYIHELGGNSGTEKKRQTVEQSHTHSHMHILFVSAKAKAIVLMMVGAVYLLDVSTGRLFLWTKYHIFICENGYRHCILVTSYCYCWCWCCCCRCRCWYGHEKHNIEQRIKTSMKWMCFFCAHCGCVNSVQHFS